jgi:hypothetical protein
MTVVSAGRPWNPEPIATQRQASVGKIDTDPRGIFRG